MEIWKELPSAPDMLASSWGRLRRKPWTMTMWNGGQRQFKAQPSVGFWELSPSKRRLRLTLRVRSLNKTFCVGRSVCEAFHGPPPFPEAVSMHLDENPENNRPENLMWGTQKENLNAPGFIEYCRGRTGENSPVRIGKARKL